MLEWLAVEHKVTLKCMKHDLCHPRTCPQSWGRRVPKAHRKEAKRKRWPSIPAVQYLMKGHLGEHC